jgi:hypothetical protein
MDLGSSSKINVNGEKDINHAHAVVDEIGA